MNVAYLWARYQHARRQPRQASRDAATRALRAARIDLAPAAYVRMTTIAAAVAAIVSAVLAAVLGTMSGAAASSILLLTVATAAASGLVVRLGFSMYPAIVATGRARRIEAEYPGIVILCYALARGGLNTIDVFRAVRDEQETYGEISREFGVVVRDIEWTGKDLNTSLEDAAGGTPSQSLRSFFTGLVAILNSGADPRDYFRRQAEAQLSAGDVRTEKDLEQAGMLAETYVSGLLVLPLLLIIVIAVMSVFGGGKEGLLTAIVFMFVPFGTLAYVVLVDTLLPSEALKLQRREHGELADFGLDVIPAGAGPLPNVRLGNPADDLAPEMGPASSGLASSLPKARLRLAAKWREFSERAQGNPAEVFVVSAPLALIAFAAATSIAWTQGARGSALGVSVTTAAVFSTIGAILPVAYFHEKRTTRVRQIESALPETLGKLSGFNDRGINLLQAFQIVGRSATGPLAKELRAVDRDVNWNRHLRDALARLRRRISTPRVSRLSILLERASAASGDLKEVLDIAAQDATRTESMRAKKRQGMMSYVVVIYVVFAVFLYVAYMISNLFYGDAGFAAIAQGSAKDGGLAGGLEPAAAKTLFFQAVVIQGACAGMVAGRLGEGYVFSGLKHAAILMLLAWTVFILGVM